MQDRARPKPGFEPMEGIEADRAAERPARPRPKLASDKDPRARASRLVGFPRLKPSQPTLDDPDWESMRQVPPTSRTDLAKIKQIINYQCPHEFETQIQAFPSNFTTGPQQPDCAGTLLSVPFGLFSHSPEAISDATESGRDLLRAANPKNPQIHR